MGSRLNIPHTWKSCVECSDLTPLPAYWCLLDSTGLPMTEKVLLFFATPILV
jgi:hypothetical protein